jgi:hypothetical protein
VREARLVREINGGGDWGAVLAVHQRPSRVWSPTATQSPPFLAGERLAQRRGLQRGRAPGVSILDAVHFD